MARLGNASSVSHSSSQALLGPPHPAPTHLQPQVFPLACRGQAQDGTTGLAGSHQHLHLGPANGEWRCQLQVGVALVAERIGGYLCG